MVFETIVTDVLNKYLGDYVQDLDRSQLKIGVWGGNVVLEDVHLKPSALDELDLPVKVVFGQIGKLVLKIPWKNLYSAPVVASVERLFMLVVPNRNWNEGFLTNVVKQAELHRLEIAKQLRKETAKTKSSDTFKEKLTTQIIRNIQIKIQDIHIRYEDGVTNPDRPFSVGITLHNLSVNTADENWQECIMKEKDLARIIYKLLVLEDLAVYWNCNNQLFTHLGQEVNLGKLLQDGIHTKNKLLEDYVYILGPINSSAQLQLNPQPENANYTVPKVLLTLLMKELAIGISREQYHSMLDLLEFFNESSHTITYNKMRPCATYRGHYKKWWRYAMACILEGCGHCRFRVDWDCVMKHRTLCRTYASTYRKKVRNENWVPDMQKVLDECEDGLDVFNIWLVRQQVEAEVEWLVQKEEPKPQGSWFMSLFQRKSQKKQDSITEKFKVEMSAEEKLRLYQAIDYQEDALPAQYPTSFVEMRVSFLLNRLTVVVRDSACSDSPQVLLAELDGVASMMERRPTASAIKVMAKIKQFSMYGSKHNGVTPQIISSRTVEKSHLLDVMFETNPLDGACDQRLHMFALPLQIVYDARTVEQMTDVFQAPDSNVLSQLQAVQLNALRGMSASGLQRAIEKHTVTDIEVDLKSSYILIPYAGCYRRDEDMVVINLGHLSIVTLHKDQNLSLHSERLAGDILTQSMQVESYDKFLVELKDMQVLVSLKGEDWETALKQQRVSQLHLLQPTSLSIHANKCLVKNCTILPKLKLTGKLPAVAINVEEQRFMHLVALSRSIVFPNASEPTRAVRYSPSNVSIMGHLFEEVSDQKIASLDGDTEICCTNIELKFEMEGLIVGMYRPVHLSQDRVQGPVNLQRILDFQTLRLEVDMVVRTYDMHIAARLAGVVLTYNGPEGALRLLEPLKASTQPHQDMLTIVYTNVDKRSPEFVSKHGSVEQQLVANFTCLNILLHQEALVALLECTSNIRTRLGAERLKNSHAEVQKSPSSTFLTKPNAWCRTANFPAKLKVEAVMHELKVFLINRQQVLMHLVVEGLEAWGLFKQRSTELNTKLRNVMVLYDNVKSPHHKILSIVGDEALSAEVVVYDDRRHSPEDNVVMSIKAQLACSRIVFLNTFVTSVLEFLEVFHDAQEDIVLAMAEAAEAARQGMLEAHAKAKRIQLQIDMQAPLIVVPVNWTSLDALHMDFGKLVIRNKMVTLQPDESGRSPVVDIIHFNFQDLKLSRVALGLTGEVLSENCILKPVSFHLQLKRNLSLKWYHSMPDFIILGCLKVAQVALCKDDVQVIMKAFFQNLVSTTRSSENLIESFKRSKKLDVQRLTGKKSIDQPLTWNLKMELCTLKADLGLRRQETLAHFTMTEMHVLVCQRKTEMQVSLKVKDITVINTNPHTIHQKVLAVEGNEAMSAAVALYDRSPEQLNTQREVADNDMAVRVQMARIRVIFLSGLFSAMTEFLSAFQETQGDIAVAVAGAAEAAKLGVLEVQAKAKRIILNIDLKAPLIIVPVDPTSVNALLFDYGNLTIKNKFTEVLDADTGRVAVLDKIQLGLQNLKVSRVELGSHGEILTERWLLQPVDFLLQVNRNLSANWYKAIPDVDVQGHLKSVMVNGDQDDIQITLKVLSQNLASSGDSQEHHESGVTSPIRTKRSRSPSPSVPSIPVSFSFTMESLVLEIFHEPPKNLLNFVQSPTFGPEHSLARFTLHMLTMKGLLCSDGTISTTLLLVDCLLDDSRHGRKAKLTRLLERKADSPGTLTHKVMPRKNVEIIYMKKGEQVDVNIHIYSFNLVLNMEYLSKLGVFFTSALQTTETIPPPRLRTHASCSILSQPVRPAGTTMTISLHAEKPDIFLIEDMEDIDTSALVLRSEISCAMRIGLTTEIKGSIKDLQLYSCCYNPERRKDTLSQILQPCSVEVKGTTTQLDVHTTDVRLRVSPGTIELLTKVAKAVYGREVGQDEQQLGDPDLSDLWQHKSFIESDHWFLKNSLSDINKMATDSLGRLPSSPTTTREICIVVCPSIAITVEAGIGSYTLPMVLLNATVQGSIHNWSSQLYMNSSLGVQMAYYNSCLALWEPLIEPVESTRKGQTIHCPWELTVKMEMNKQQEKGIDLLRDDFEVIPHEPSTMNISIFSKDNLELVLTKTCLDVLTNLSKAFEMAVDEGLRARAGPTAPYLVCNHLGLPVSLLLQAGLFKVHGSSEQQIFQLESGASIGLSVDYSSTPSPVNLMTRGCSDERFLKILVHQLECVIDLPVIQANQRFFPLHSSCGMVSAVRVENSCTTVTLRSVVQVFNHLGVPVDVRCRTKQGPELDYVGTVAPAECLDLPLYAVYTPTNELFFCVPGFYTIPYIWTDSTALSDARLYECKPEHNTPSKEPYFLRITGQLEQVYYKTMQIMSGTCYRVHIRPVVVVKNMLPISLVCHQPGTTVSKTLEAGEHIQLTTTRPGVSNILFHIAEYRQRKWECLYKVDPNCQEFAVVEFISDRTIHMQLGMHTIKRNGSIVMSLYCPFWMLNKTGMQLSYNPLKSSEILHHPPTTRSPVLFPSFSNKNKVAVNVGNGSGMWSDPFFLDVAGSSGVITCCSGNMVYKIGVHIHLMRAALIKQVTFTPYYVLINNSRHSIECQEVNKTADPWVKVEAGGCCPLWPRTNNETVSLRARVFGTRLSTAAFSCGTVHTTLLQLHNKYGGLNVDVQITEGAVYITFTSYEYGQAPAIIMNYTGMLIHISEKGSDNVHILNPMELVVFTWSNPSGPRQLKWAPNMDVDVCKLSKDGSGSCSLEHDLVIYWSSFLDGLQRVLLFSGEHIKTEQQQDKDRVLQKVTVAIQGLGLSFVNDHTCSELMYISISKKPTLKERRSKTVQSSSIQKISHYNEVGLWVQVRLLPHELQLHAKVNHLQADNQLANCIYPITLAPISPPRSVVANALKPFAELSMVRRSMRHSNLQQFKYVMLLVQEFHIKLDIAFVTAVLTMLEAGQVTDDVEAAHFLEDRRLVFAPLLAHVVLHSSQGQKNFFDILHFSPLKIHLSFSLGSGHYKSGHEMPHVLRILLRSLGVTLTDVQDVVFKLAYFERRNTFLTNRQVASEAVLHYRGQALKQLYVLVLGLDVLGNPYGLVLGLKQGVEDFFYEPFQGAIQGPEEFAEGLVLGVRSLLGHTVGGAAGAMSRITGVVGKGVAALTFDEDYQRKRQETLSQRPANVQTGLAQSSKGLVMGMVDGVSGVFVKPISGAKKEGVGGFFKGVGKGVVGLVARPTSGIIDFASGSLDAVKRTTDTTVEVTRQRPPRFFHRDGLLRPYVRKEAEGNKLLQELDERHIAASDVYEFHVLVEPGCKNILMVTNKRVMFLNYVEMFDKWKLDWEQAWSTLTGMPMILAEGIYFPTEKSSKKVMGLLGSNSTGRVVLIKDSQQKKWIVEKIKVLMKN